MSVVSSTFFTKKTKKTKKPTASVDRISLKVSTHGFNSELFTKCFTCLSSSKARMFFSTPLSQGLHKERGNNCHIHSAPDDLQYNMPLCYMFLSSKWSRLHFSAAAFIFCRCLFLHHKTKIKTTRASAKNTTREMTIINHSFILPSGD